VIQNDYGGDDMNRNRYRVSLDEDKIFNDIRIIIFLLMLISLGIGVTKTYFTSRVALEANLNMTMGTFQFELRDMDETKELQPINIDGIMPGESVTKDIYVENIGTLNGILSVEFYNFYSDLGGEEEAFLTSFSYVLDVIKDGVTYSISQGSFNELKNNGNILVAPFGAENPIVIGPNEELLLRFKITFNCDDIEIYNGKSFTFDISIGSTQENYRE